MKVIVIGAGASGMAAALAASENGAEVTVLEASRKTGRKLLATGNGRCNLMNTGKLRYFGGKETAEKLFSLYPGRVRAFFEGLGLRMVEEDGGRVYPACGQASAVREVLETRLAENGVRVICESPVTGIRSEKGSFRVLCGEKSYTADRVILCAGGMAGKNLGHDGSAYKLAQGFGHTVVPPEPALTGLCIEKKQVQGLSGLRVPAYLSLECEGRVLDRARGELLFTDYGVSGVCVMQLSRAAGQVLKQKPVIYADLSPLLGLAPRLYDHPENAEDSERDPEKEIRALLCERRKLLPEKDLLCGLLPSQLAGSLAHFPRERLPHLLARYPLPVTGVRGFDQAQVTAGGLEASGFDGHMQSRCCPGLYACGEILDVDGDCGGFNLQFAFLTGILAGEHAAGALNKE